MLLLTIFGFYEKIGKNQAKGMQNVGKEPSRMRQGGKDGKSKRI